MQLDHRSTKPGAGSSNLPGRANNRKDSLKGPTWPPTAAQIGRFALDVDASAGRDACHPWQGRGQIAGMAPADFALALKLGRALEPGDRAAQACGDPGCCNQRHLCSRAARREAYLAAYQATGLTRQQAEARQADVERMGRAIGRQLKAGKLSPAQAIQQLRSAFGVSELPASSTGRARTERAA